MIKYIIYILSRDKNSRRRRKKNSTHTIIGPYTSSYFQTEERTTTTTKRRELINVVLAFVSFCVRCSNIFEQVKMRHRTSK